MKKIAFLLLVISTFFLESCCRKVTSLTHTIRDTTSIVVTERVVDTFIDKDTITETIQIACDSQNKPYLVSGSGIKYGTRSALYSSFNNGRVEIHSKCDELNIKIKAQDSMIRQVTRENKELKLVQERKTTFWDYLKMIGLHILYVAGVIIGYELIRKIYYYFN